MKEPVGEHTTKRYITDIPLPLAVGVEQELKVEITLMYVLQNVLPPYHTTIEFDIHVERHLWGDYDKWTFWEIMDFENGRFGPPCNSKDYEYAEDYQKMVERIGKENADNVLQAACSKVVHEFGKRDVALIRAYELVSEAPIDED